MNERKQQAIVWDDDAKHVGDITLYPVQMRMYTEWQRCKHALLVRQSTLPVKYVFMPYLAALHAADCDYGSSLIGSLIQALALAMRIHVGCFSVYVSRDDRTKLEFILCRSIVNKSEIKIDSANFPAIRRAIVEQNGESIPDEGDNPELVETEAYINEANSRKNRIEYDINTLVSSVAYHCNIRKKEIAEWSIREFVETKNAIDRGINYIICGIAEKIPMFKWTKGNPCPSWCFDPVKEGSAALESMSAFASRTGINSAQ